MDVSYFDQLAQALRALDRAQLDQLLAMIRATQARSGTLWLCGNGGSHAVAQHWACDLTKAAGMRCAALGTNAPLLTAWANDTQYAGVFAAELWTHARPGDSLIALSCSGRSPNIVAVLQRARRRGLAAALVTQAGRAVDGVLVVGLPSDNDGVLEDCFAAIGHWLTGELRHDVA